MFRTVNLSIIRSFSLYTQQWYMSYRFADSLKDVCKPVWHIPLPGVQWKTPDEGQRNCPKHVEFQSKNKFEKLVHLVGFIIRNLSRFTVTWASQTNNIQNTHTHLRHLKLLQHHLLLTEAIGRLLNHEKQKDRQGRVSRQEGKVTVYQVRCRHDINITTLLLVHNYNSFVSRQSVC